MLKYVRVAMTAGFALVLLLPLAAHANTPEQIFVRVSPSVVVVDIFDAMGRSIGQGSGVVIGAGEVITNCHVAQKGKSLQVRQLGKTFVATVLYAEPDRDLCQLSVPDLQAQPTILGTASKLRVGQRVYAIGAPQGLELTLSEGLISSLRPYEGSQYIQTSAAISPGSSGGGLFDDEGQLVGITTFQLIEGQNLNFALPVDWIGELPKRVQAPLVVAKKSGLDWLNRAAALDQKEDWPGLLKFSQQWVKTEPKSVDAWYSLGRAYDGLNQYDQVTQAYREALRIEPENANAWLFLALTYGNLKQFDQAVHAYREVLRIHPENADIWGILGNVYQSKLKQYDQAVQAYQEVVRIQPKDAKTWDVLGLAYSELKQYDQAIQAHREALRIKPNDAFSWSFLGHAYFEVRQYDKAIQAYQEVIRFEPASTSAWYKLGASYSARGNRDKVLEIYQTIRKLHPETAERYFNEFILP